MTELANVGLPPPPHAQPAHLRKLEQLSPRVYRYADICNVYIVTSGERALLIDAGRGSVLGHLHAIGVSQVEWVLHTHHHRDQCQGDSRLVEAGARIAVPEREAHLFEDAEGFWQRLEIFNRYDCSNVFSTSRTNFRVDSKLADYTTFRWEELTILCQPTPGHTRGSLTYLVEIDGLRYAFCGDLIADEGRLWALHDLHWSYDNPDALNCALHSAHILRQKKLDRLAPSHGHALNDPNTALDALSTNLRRLYAVAGTRYQGDTDVPIAADPRFRRVSEHLLAVTQTSAHFYVLKDDDGRALFFDYGFPSFDHVGGASARFVEHSLPELEALFGVHTIDAVIPTHYHDDHVAGIPWLQEHRATEAWVFDEFADVLANPSAYNLPALWGEPIDVTKTFADGDTISWGDYRFEARHCFSHTWYGVALFGDVDGLRIGIIGDEIQLDGQGRMRGGGPVYRNGLRSDSFVKSLRTILDYEPEIILTGHDGPLKVTKADLEAAYRWCVELESSFHALAAFPEEIEFAVQPSPARIHPYQTSVAPGEPVSLTVEVTNFHTHGAEVTVELKAPHGWTIHSEVQTTYLEPAEAATLPFSVTPTSTAESRRHVITADIRIGERDLGETTEALITVRTREK